MEECFICFEETKETEFIVFSCNHKICKKCIPSVFMYSTKCPVCENPLVIYVPNTDIRPRQVNYECYKIFCSISLISLGFFYLVHFVFKN
jgi:hypothetical protein